MRACRLWTSVTIADRKNLNCQNGNVELKQASGVKGKWSLLYTTQTHPLMSLVHAIGSGSIGLPELQRPFVWPNAKVRDLFDSLYRGYPTGFLLLWETGVAVKSIGVGEKAQAPTLAVVDGQQRLTSLYAVVTGAEVVRSDFKKEKIRIAFDPLAERFEVANAATEKDPAFISDISVVWKNTGSIFQISANYLERIQSVREISPEEISRVQNAFGKLAGLAAHPFNALVLTTTADVATVADVFVRINGQGTKLNEADFILTLMSVYWEEGRKELEAFSHAAAGPPDGKTSPRNFYIEPSPSQLLRVLAGVGLRRGRLSAVYAALRGRVPQTGEVDAERQRSAFDKLTEALPCILSLTRWHHFLGSLSLAGHLSGKTLTSEQSILYSYAFYLIGVEEYGVALGDMGQAVAEFLFMASMTSRYGSAAESQFEQDLNALSAASDKADYLKRLRRLSELQLTDDFWDITLPNALATSGANTPARYAYWAALVKLEARVLYSEKKISQALAPGIASSKTLAENHHLYPKAYLAKIGVTDQKQTNQIANYALVEWPDNLKISGTAPEAYAPELEAKLSTADRKHHALPPEWWLMPYEAFLTERRRMMANVVREAWQALRGESLAVNSEGPTAAELAALGESAGVEFKSTLRANLHTGQTDDKMQLAALKTLAGFLNTGGGTLLIGVADDGTPIGLEADAFPSEDKLALHFMNLVRDRIGPVFGPYIHPKFVDLDGIRVLSVRVEKGPKPAFVKDGNVERFYVRAGPSTTELHGSNITQYSGSQW